MREKILLTVLVVMLVGVAVLVWQMWPVEPVTGDSSTSVAELKQVLQNVATLDISECAFAREYAGPTGRGIPGPDEAGAMIVGRARVRGVAGILADDASGWIAVERADVSQGTAACGLRCPGQRFQPQDRILRSAEQARFLAATRAPAPLHMSVV